MKHDHILYTTMDPTMLLNDAPIPAISILLLRVCDNDREKFDEALRLLVLFLDRAEELNKR